MFSQDLSSEQRDLLLHLLREVAEADGTLCGREADLLGSVASLLGATEPAGATQRDVTLAFREPRAARIAIMDMVNLAFVDDDYSDLERKVISTYADCMGVDTPTLRTIETWVEMGRLWKRQGDLLLSS